jgi:acetyltransferase-like isoleucine patch superfamily enzyme
VYLDARTAPIELYAWAGASIVIGDDAYIGGGTSIEATGSILVGARAHLGAFCKVMDNHFHPLVGNRNTRPLPRPVVLGADVRVGPRAIVMAGARIAQGTKVEAGAVVKRATRAGAGAANG